MKVPSLGFKIEYVFIRKIITNISDTNPSLHCQTITGTTETTWYLEEQLGIKISRSSVYNSNKLLSPTKFPFAKNKEEILGWGNWALNYPRGERAEFYTNEPNKSRFIDNNPFTDIKIRISKIN